MKTEVIKLETGRAGETQLECAAARLRAGELVAFPTETVYGIGANADQRGSLARLTRLKCRPASKPFTIHIADKEDVGKFVCRAPLLAEKLIKRCWPGPLTLVLEKGDGTTVGLRLPDHEQARSLIRRARITVVAPSANPPGQPPAVKAKQVLTYLGGKIELLLDGGQTRFKKPSTVMRFKGNAYEILREGAFSPRQVRRSLNVIILFICTGNTCRSPMAKGLCRKMLAQWLHLQSEELEEHGYTVASAGTGASFSAAPSSNALAVMKERGIDISDHLTQKLERKLVEEADFVFPMTETHRMRALELYPQAGQHLTVFNVNDPMSGDLDIYRKTADRIEHRLEQQRERILAAGRLFRDTERSENQK